MAGPEASAEEILAGMVPGGAVVVLTASAITAYHEAVTLCSSAISWANDISDYSSDDIASGKALELAVARLRRAAAMELSLYRWLSHLATVRQDHDGPCIVTRDGEACFFWRHTKSGYHGGLIYHPDYADAGTTRLPVGSWSIHT